MEIKNKYYLYCHCCKGVPFYVGVGSKHYGETDYSRANDFRPNKRNKFWLEEYLNCEDFLVDIVEEWNSKTDISLREKIWIIELGRKNVHDDGYLTNIVPGGYRNTSNPSKIAKYSKDGILIKVYENIYKASEDSTLSTKNIYASRSWLA